MSFLLNKQDVSLVPTSDDLSTKKDINPVRDVPKLEIFKSIEGEDDDQAAGGLYTDQTTEKIIASDNKKSTSSSKTGVHDHMALPAERLSSMLGSGMLSTGTIKKEQKILEQVVNAANENKLKGDVSSPKSDHLAEAIKFTVNREVHLKLEEELRILKEEHLVIKAMLRDLEQIKERDERHRNIIVRDKFSIRRG